MNNFYLFIGILGIVAALLFVRKEFFSDRATVEKEKIDYKYKKKNFFLTRAEHECYNALISAVGADFYIFSQVHLSALVDHTIPGQDWRAALAHINRKSVDFVLCDKDYLAPKLAIELDDRSHDRPERQARDREVERILREVGMPLLRLDNHGVFSPEHLAEQIRKSLQ